MSPKTCGVVVVTPDEDYVLLINPMEAAHSAPQVDFDTAVSPVRTYLQQSSQDIPMTKGQGGRGGRQRPARFRAGKLYRKRRCPRPVSPKVRSRPSYHKRYSTY